MSRLLRFWEALDGFVAPGVFPAPNSRRARHESPTTQLGTIWEVLTTDDSLGLAEPVGSLTTAPSGSVPKTVPGGSA